MKEERDAELPWGRVTHHLIGMFVTLLYSNCYYTGTHWTISSGLSTDALQDLGLNFKRTTQGQSQVKRLQTKPLQHCLGWMLKGRGQAERWTITTVLRLKHSRQHVSFVIITSENTWGCHWLQWISHKTLNMMLRLVSITSSSDLIEMKRGEAQSPKDKKV